MKPLCPAALAPPPPLARTAALLPAPQAGGPLRSGSQRQQILQANRRLGQPHHWRQRLGLLLAGLLLLITAAAASPAWASLEDDRYDGNIFALYAGNGSLVPPRSSLEQSFAAQRVAVVIYYLDDSSVSKRFAPVVSELQRQWGNNIDLIPLVTDPLQDRPLRGDGDPARYWRGAIPQVVVFNRSGELIFDAEGAVAIEAIDAAISQATGIPLPEGAGPASTLSFNELNREVVAPQP